MNEIIKIIRPLKRFKSGTGFVTIMKNEIEGMGLVEGDMLLLTVQKKSNKYICTGCSTEFIGQPGWDNGICPTCNELLQKTNESIERQTKEAGIIR